MPDPAPPAEPSVSPPTLRHVPGKSADTARSLAAPPPRIVEGSTPARPTEARSAVRGALLVAVLVIVAYAGALLFFRYVAPNRPQYVAEIGAGLAIGIVVFFLHTLVGGSVAESMQIGEERFRALLGFLALIAPSFVRWILFACLGGMIVVAYQDLGEWSPSSIARLRVLGACVMPVILAVCSAMLVERRFARGDFRLKVGYGAGTAMRDRIELREKVERMWAYENELMRESVQRMARHATILGFIASAILIACGVILLRYARTENELRHLVALSVGAACTVSFTLNLGQILFRSASNDSTARMMAFAARTLLIVSVATVFLGVALLSGPEEATNTDKGYLFQGYKGALIVGVAVALLGERVLRAVTDRAATMLGVGTAAPIRGSDLGLIDGLNDEDVARLAEERIDSAHALAFMPTPRIFFNTTYSLQRICDWQDQALLIARVGRTNAQLLREQYLVRGAIAARQLAREIVGPSRSASSALRGPTESWSGEPISVPSEPQEDERDRLRALAKALGFTGINQAVLGLRCLVDDEEIERLEVFSRSVPVWKDAGTEHVRDEVPRVELPVNEGRPPVGRPSPRGE
ncbi:hypothetical protein [Polyangium sorediatum]|uniref:Uncharacterized protein n=1 Tax=Polyangium sorediatum TaxID=889274 RepID=A0ABT6NQ74_9BACT|nr:hypothetical protein [Polyangium sorediatum]MDI1430463.1 hypothetical protein [Polyangium sorediatum]